MCFICYANMDNLRILAAKIISAEQMGCIKKRFIGTNIRAILHICENIEINNSAGILLLLDFEKAFDSVQRGHGGRVVTLSPPTSEAGVRSPSWPQVGKLVVACRWLAVYSTDP